MLRLLLVRHGETEWNAHHRYQGQTDVPLSEVGKQQAESLARRLVGEQVDALYVSDLQRAIQTAAIITQKTGWGLNPDSRLREINFGVVEGLTFAEAQKRYPKVLQAWLRDYDQPPEGAETLDTFSARVQSFLTSLQADHNNQSVLLVSHGGPLTELARRVLDLPPARRWALALDNASLSELILGEDGFPWLKRWNDTCHL